MSKISLYVWGLGWGLGVWLVGWWVVRYTLVKNLLIKFLMMLFLVAKGCKFDSRPLKDWDKFGYPNLNHNCGLHLSKQRPH